MPGLTAWQGLFEHGRLQAGQSVLVHGAAGVVGSMAIMPSTFQSTSRVLVSGQSTLALMLYCEAAWASGRVKPIREARTRQHNVIQNREAFTLHCEANRLRVTSLADLSTSRRLQDTVLSINLDSGYRSVFPPASLVSFKPGSAGIQSTLRLTPA